MRTTVTISGIVLTRAQVEEAMNELNAPELAMLTRVHRRNRIDIEGIVLVGGDVQSRYCNSLRHINGKYTVVHKTGGGGSTYTTSADLLVDWIVITENK